MIHRRDALLGMTILGAFLFVAILAVMIPSDGRAGGVKASRKSVAVVEITGPIYSARPVVEKLERYMKNSRIPAIVIRLNTPGGAVEPTQEIFATVLKARAKGKKVIGSMGTIAASGGYYIAAACDTVMASPSTLTGSIGVIADFAEFSGLMKKLGIDVTVVKSGAFKDVGSPTRPMTEDEKALLSGVIMDTYDQFVEAVSKGRSMNPETVRKYADGRVFTGRQARDAGFVDLLGTYQDAIDLAGRMTGLGDDPPTIREERNRIVDMIAKGMSDVLIHTSEISMPRLSFRMW